MRPTRYTIIKVGAEGGDITLFGFQDQKKQWYFTCHVVDQTPELLDQDWVVHNSDVVNSFSEALGLLDEYPWHKLYPVEVHPDFRSQVYEAVLGMYIADNDTVRRQLYNWQEVCEIRSD